MEADRVPDDWRISNDLWDGIALLLPEHKNTHRFGGGRPRTPDRVCMEAILFVLRTGCQWKALDATRFCPGSTAHDRFQEWVAAGVFEVEFSDDQGRTYAQLPLRDSQLLVLRFQPQRAA